MSDIRKQAYKAKEASRNLPACLQQQGCSPAMAASWKKI